MWRRVAAAAWIGGLAAGIVAAVAPYGFNVADEGLVLSYTQRMLDGQVPHADFISPRPIGSSLLHLVDLLPPFPVALTSRAIGLLVIVAYSVVFAIAIFGRPPSRWRVGESFAVGASALVNIHTFPPMPWYTTDGLLLIAAGCVMVLAGKSPKGAMLLFGAAAIVKQSFAPAILIGALLVGRRSGVRSAAVALALGLAPLLVYTLVVGALGGLGEMASQLSGSGVPSLKAALGLDAHLVPLLFIALVWVCAGAGGRLAVLVPVAAVGAVALLTQEILLTALEWNGDWGSASIQAALLVLALRGLLERTLDECLLVITAAGFMTALSFGAPTANLVAGTTGLIVCHRVLVRAGPLAPERLRGLGVAAAGVLAGLATVAVFVDARAGYTYLDLTRGKLTASLGDIAPDLRGLRTGPLTAQYVREVRACTRRFPAPTVVVHPDNAVLYDALGLKNPLPIDWIYELDYDGAEDQLRDSVRALARRGGYLLLLQTVRAEDINDLAELPPARPEVPIVTRDAPFLVFMVNTLDGRRISCGSFHGLWRPRVS